MSSSTWKQIDCGTERWVVDPDWQQHLLGEEGLRLEEWTRAGNVEIIKDSEHRTIYRVGLPDKSIFVKYYPERDFLSRIRQWIRSAKAWIEWQRTLVLRERSVPTVKPVAVGKHPVHGSYIITEEIPHAQPLQQYFQQHWTAWKQAGQHRECRLLMTEMARFIAQIIQGGINHHDLHPGNILLHRNDLGQRIWYLIDPYSVGTLPPCDRKSFLNALVLLSHTFWYDVTAHDRLRAWVELRRASGFHFERKEERVFLAELHQKVHQQIYYIWNDRANRNTKANRDFYEQSVRRFHAWASRKLPADWLNEFLFDPALQIHHPRSTILKVSRHGMVAVLPAGKQSVVVKQFKPRHAADRWLSRYRRSPAYHCYRMAYRLETAQIPTARPFAVVEKRRHGRLEMSYVIMEHLQQTISLGDYWSQASEQQRQSCLVKLADLVQRLHMFRMSHRDLKVINILVRQAEVASPDLYLIDLRGVSYSRWLSNSRKKKDLARLALSALTSLSASRTDLLRFLKLYLKPEEQAHWRNWWKPIAALMSMKIVQNQKRNRIVS